MEKQNEPQQKIFVFTVLNQKDKLQTELNRGYTVRYALPKGAGYIFILDKPEPEIRPPVQQPKEIEAFRVLNPRSEDCQRETKSLQKQGFKIDSVSPSSAILIKYKEVKKNE
jgi:hypothetical protein